MRQTIGLQQKTTHTKETLWNEKIKALMTADDASICYLITMAAKDLVVHPYYRPKVQNSGLAEGRE